MADIVGYTRLGTPIWKDREDSYIVIGEAYTPCGYLPEPSEEDLLTEDTNGEDSSR